jgi:hypothetical protein
MPSVEVDITKLFVRDAPLYHAMSTEETVFADPRFAVMNDPTPRSDHLVPRLLSNAFEGTLPSLPLAVTEVGVNTGSVVCPYATGFEYIILEEKRDTMISNIDKTVEIVFLFLVTIL